MEDLNIKDWIAIISSIGTFLSSIFVLMTLFELKTQRKQSYIPELIIPEVCFNYNNNFPNLIKIWTTDDNKELFLKIHNIGLGVAKDIDFEWEYDIYEMIEKFYKLSSDTKGELYIEDNRLIYLKNNIVEAGSSLSIDNRHLDFLLAHTDNNDVYNLELPNSYLSIATAIYKNAKIKEIFNLDKFEGAILPLNLNIRYKDVGGSDITKKLKIDVKFFVKSINLGVNDSDKIIKMRGRVYISKI